MNIILLSIVLLLVILVVVILCKEKNNYKPFDIKSSVLLNNGDRGLFATRDYKEGDIIERCPTISVDRDSQVNILNDYYYDSIESDKFLLSFGYCSLINHSKEKQNCTWEVIDNNNYIKMYAIKDISKGEELYVHYGDDYWNERDYKEK